MTTPILTIDGETYTTKIARLSWTKAMNEINIATIILRNVTRSDTHVVENKVVTITENSKAEIHGVIRGVKYNGANQECEITIKGYAVRLMDRKYISGGEYTYTWTAQTSETIVEALVDGQAVVAKGTIDAYGTSYTYTITDDYILNGIKKNALITGYEWYESQVADGSNS